MRNNLNTEPTKPNVFNKLFLNQEREKNTEKVIHKIQPFLLSTTPVY